MRLLLCGPDGTGKSTIAAALLPRLGPVEHAHFRRRLLPRAPEANGAPPRRSHSRTLPVATAKVVAQFAEWVAAELIRFGDRRSLLIERGWHDQVVDPLRYRLPSPVAAFAGGLGALLPQYDVAVLCGGNASAIHARKPELSAEEIDRQLTQWRYLAARVARTVVEIDTVRESPAACLKRILTAIEEARWRRPLIQPRTRRVYLSTGTPWDEMRRLYEPGDFAAAAALRASITFPPLRRRLSSQLVARLCELMTDTPEIRLRAVISSSTNGRWVGLGEYEGGRVFVKHATSHDAGLSIEAEHLRDLGFDRRVPELIRWTPLPRPTLVTRAMEGFSPGGLDTAVDAVLFLADRDLTHGDLTPWNVRQKDAGFCLLDLETAKIPHRPFVDLAHFAVAVGVLARDGRPADVGRRLQMISRQIGEYAEKVVGSPDWQVPLAQVLREQEWNTASGRRFAAELAGLLVSGTEVGT
jgi:hypothetical protein